MRSSFYLVVPFVIASTVALPPNATTASNSSSLFFSASSKTVSALDDATIVFIYDEANSADIETGQLAVERGSTKEVRDFGATLVRDHNAARQLGRDLAKKLGVTPAPLADDPYAKGHVDAMAKLKPLHGKEFDKAFMKHEVAYHVAVIDAIQNTLLPATKNAELKALEIKIVPAFQGHLVMAQTLEKKIFAM
ncbi:MAG: DUF4142 domain-containing protein [Gemmatimonadaceae bacterium]